MNGEKDRIDVPRRRPARVHLFLLALGLVLAWRASAIAYQTPSDAIASIIDAPRTPLVRVDPTRTHLAILGLPGYPPIGELAERRLGLAGIRIRPRLRAPAWSWSSNGMTLLRIDPPEEREVRGLPADPRIDNVLFSPDGSKIAFTHAALDGTELWVVDVATASARRLAPGIIHLAMGARPVWAPDDRSLLALLVPDGLGEEPLEPEVPEGPIVQESLGRSAPARTYQDLLENAHDEALFDHHFVAQIAQISLDGRIQRVGEPAIVASFDPSPDGRFLLVESIRRPYSYTVPAWRFPTRIEVWDRQGKVVARVADLPLREEVPIRFDSVAEGPRSVRWREDADATLCWVEAIDGGDAERDAEVRDRLFLFPAPFDAEPQRWLDLSYRARGIQWASDDLALVQELWWKGRRTRLWRARPGRIAEPPDLLVDRSTEDRYADPGSPLTETDERGRTVLRTGDGGRTIFLKGDGASPEGGRPFLDAFDLDARTSKRLFRSSAPHYEEVLALLDRQASVLLTRREAVEEPPNIFLRSLPDSALRPITRFPHPTPQLLGVRKELIRYQREDGLPLSGTLYTPPGHDSTGGPLPALLWVYPQDFKDADLAGQITDSPHRFNRVGWWSPVLWVLRGFAVLDDPQMPIVGEGDEDPNDTYVEQLVMGARAAIGELVRRGVADSTRIVVGGHSYGAFTTANLLAHTNLFAAGLARTGAYNRTLTPFGFQSEERTLWEAPGAYVNMSPFLHADRIDEPILLIHGEADANPGTFPMQSERFYHALKGLGGTVRLVMLPCEDHSYRGRESLLHVLWETERWLDRYVLGRGGPGR